MNPKSSLSKAEIVLCVLALISIPVYGLALFMGGTFAWLFIGYALVIIAWSVIFVLPNLLKQIRRRENRPIRK